MKKMVTLGAAVALLALSCGEEEGVTPPGPERPEPTSPANVLENVELAFNNRDVDLLKAMLSAEFVFYFDPDDVGQNPPGKPYKIPESWSYTAFWQAVNNMFTKAYSISLTIPTGGVGTPGENETKYRADNVSINLLVMVDELNGYIADQGYCNFAFESYTSEAGKNCWRLTGWWDRTSGMPADGHLGLAPTSLGRILAVFY
jgi:hypothetical protein